MPILYTLLQSTDTRSITQLSLKQGNLDATSAIDRKGELQLNSSECRCQNLKPNIGSLNPETSFLSFWPCCPASGTLVPWQGIEPRLSALRAQNLNHQTSREFPEIFFQEEKPEISWWDFHGLMWTGLVVSWECGEKDQCHQVSGMNILWQREGGSI